MVISFSLIMAVLLFNLAMLAISLLRKKTGYIAKYSTAALVFLAILGAFRIILPFSFPFTFIIRSYEAIPWLISILHTNILLGPIQVELLTLIAIVWAVGAVVVLVRASSGLIRHSKSRKMYIHSSHRNAMAVASKLGLRRINIIVSPNVQVPFVIGILRATVYLPDLALSNDELEMILLHEYQHFKSKDVLIKGFYLMLALLFWWNPIVHTFQRDLDCLLELRCDAAMTRRMNKSEKLTYLFTLADIREYIESGERVFPNTISTLLQADQTGFLEQRIRLIQYGKADIIRQFASIAIVVLLFTSSYLIIIQPAFNPPQYEVEDATGIYAESSFIYKTCDGRFKFFAEGQFVFEIQEYDLTTDLFADLPIITLMD